ncbi:MAG TPA: metalloregulator ArsR/SmtB family transcription factor [Candidatus Cybelea sp.]|nr:metalloregulator ArsR/SmtB family transcription factor [Candidatus Cybelea sp.]
MLVNGITPGSIRFTFSPLQEVTRAIKVFVEPRPHAEQMGWLRYARRHATPGLKRAAKRFTCLLTPTPELFPNVFPSSKAATFAQELALLSKSKRAFREAMVRRFIGRSFLMRAEITVKARAEALACLARETSARNSEEALSKFCDLLKEFFERCLAPHWNHFESAARRDSRARETLLQRFGLTCALRTLTRELTATGNRRTAALEFGERESRGKQLEFAPKGRLVLTPSYFIWPHATFVILRGDTVDVRIAYPLASPVPLAQRAVHWKGAAKRFAALADPTRLHMLELLANRNLSTREFAGMLGLSEGGVSRHLSILRNAELVTCARESYFVLYRRTQLASSLLSSFLTAEQEVHVRSG